MFLILFNANEILHKIFAILSDYTGITIFDRQSEKTSEYYQPTMGFSVMLWLPHGVPKEVNLQKKCLGLTPIFSVLGSK